MQRMLKTAEPTMSERRRQRDGGRVELNTYDGCEELRSRAASGHKAEFKHQCWDRERVAYMEKENWLKPHLTPIRCFKLTGASLDETHGNPRDSPESF
ncbi:hypothetical protein EYF80_011943 [Liparis tanakae]|uniref:Uncharacterized protein n=1 Tax=Liparis tanakae TaxID=230148 RepID=A0A4Z2IJ03_9TELE|nr:hypothetical protein EYF80_011943 [Liparis tanakae]